MTTMNILNMIIGNIYSVKKKDLVQFNLSPTVHPLWLKYVSYIQIDLFILHGYITNSQCDQLLIGLIAQLEEHCTGIAEVMGSNPVKG